MIHRLDDTLINQIAAGEVIERPVSIVRELVDNCLDAGALEISVSVIEGGKNLIRVVDNGKGILGESLSLAFERYTTSKIEKFEDLQTLSSRGFRGEALSSILSVSHTRVITRHLADSTATELLFEGGNQVSSGHAHRQEGTTIEIRNLFFNVPARRKFLKSDKVEEAKIVEWMRHIAFTSPNVLFQLFVDGQEQFVLLPKNSFLERARDLFPGAFHTVTYSSDSEWSIQGRIAHPSVVQRSSSGLVAIVNGRVVSDRLILRAVKDAFQSSLKEKEQPIGVLSLRVPSLEVDINVHPQKKEVRFAHPQAVYTHVHRAVSSLFRDIKAPFFHHSKKEPEQKESTEPASYAPFFTPLSRQASAHPSVLESRSAYQTPVSLPSSRPSDDHRINSDLEVSNSNVEISHAQDGINYGNLIFRCQVLGCYLIGEDNKGLVVLDMHAAHERINFQSILSRWQQEGGSSQLLTVPLEIPLSSEVVPLFKDILSELDNHGFECRVKGSSVFIYALPSRLMSTSFGAREIGNLINDIVAYIKEGYLPDTFSGFLYERAARLACHASIRAGQILSPQEARALFDALDKTTTAGACPHGRPTAVRITPEQIGDWFFRD